MKPLIPRILIVMFILFGVLQLLAFFSVFFAPALMPFFDPHHVQFSGEPNIQLKEIIIDNQPAQLPSGYWTAKPGEAKKYLMGFSSLTLLYEANSGPLYGNKVLYAIGICLPFLPSLYEGNWNLNDENSFITFISLKKDGEMLNLGSTENSFKLCSNSTFPPINGRIEFKDLHMGFKNFTANGSIEIDDSFVSENSRHPVKLSMDFDIDTELIYSFSYKSGENYEW